MNLTGKHETPRHLLFGVLVSSISALALCFCASELHGVLRTPDLTWWQSLVFLWAVALVGAAFNGSLVGAMKKE